MGATLDYSTTAGSNTTVGGVSIAEGMAPGGVNNAMRAMMADTRKWQLDWSGVTTAGSSNAYTMTCNQGIAAYADGMRFSFRADRNNTGAATLNIDARGAKALRKVTGGALVALVADDIVAKAIYDVAFNAADDVFVIVGFALPTISAFALGLLDDADAATARTTLGAQASDATLTSLSGLSLVAGDILYATAPDTLARLAAGDTGQAARIAGGVPTYSGLGYTWLSPQATTSGTTFDFTGIPAWATEIAVLLDQYRITAGSTGVQLRVAGSPVATGYTASSGTVDGSAAVAIASATGFGMFASTSLAGLTGNMSITKWPGSNVWIATHTGYRRGTNEGTIHGGGRIALAGAPDGLRLLVTGGNADQGSAVVGYR